MGTLKYSCLHAVSTLSEPRFLMSQTKKTPLHFAAVNDHDIVVQLLLGANSSIDEINQVGDWGDWWGAPLDSHTW